MKFLALFFLFFSFSALPSELMIIDEGRDLYFIVVGSDGDEIAVDRRTFNLNDGLNVSVYAKGKNFTLGASDNGTIKSGDFRLTDSVIIGRRIPKMFLSSFYNITKSGEYFFDVKVCLNENHCLIENQRRVHFSTKDFPIP